MTERRWVSTLRRLRPDSRHLGEIAKARTLTETAASALMLPFVLAGIIWLSVTAPVGQIQLHLPQLIVLLAAYLLIERRPFRFLVSLGGGRRISVGSSLSGLATWSMLVVFGPVMLWAQIAASAVSLLWDSWQARRLHQDALWVPLSAFMQRLGSGMFTDLLALAVYVAGGGEFPLEAATPIGWLPVVYATLVKAIVPALISMPILMVFNSLLGAANTLETLAGFVLSLAVFTLPMLLFSVLAPLLYADGGLFSLGFYLIGLSLVNLLAHYLSRSTERSQQRSSELTRLESLGEAIIRSPADGSELAKLLKSHISSMFQQDEVTIRFFDGSDPSLVPPLDLTFPEEAQTVDDEVWDRLRAEEDTYLVLRQIKPRGTQAAVGDAVVVKILAVTSEQADSSLPCHGGIYLMRPYTQGEVDHVLPVVQALASQIAAALYRAEVHEETLVHEKTIQELAFAGRIQASFLPREEPRLAGWDVKAKLSPARETSGDFYDFIQIADGRLGLVVADVADKGMGAALYMALSRTLIRTYAMAYPDEPQRVLEVANQRILSDAESDQFVTVFYGILDPATHELAYANAGHNPSFLIHVAETDDGDGEPTITRLGHSGIPLGMFGDVSWQCRSVFFQPGDTLVMYTDGVTEAQNEQGMEFGERRLQDAVNGVYERTASSTIEAVLTAISEFSGEAVRSDDITIMVVICQDAGNS